MCLVVIGGCAGWPDPRVEFTIARSDSDRSTAVQGRIGVVYHVYSATKVASGEPRWMAANVELDSLRLRHLFWARLIVTLVREGG